jgi:hypothetical protein
MDKKTKRYIQALEDDGLKARNLLVTCRQRMKDTFFLTRYPGQRPAGLRLMEDLDDFLATEQPEKEE